MRILILLTFAICLCAGEADAKAEARTVWTAAAKAGDAWTCLQLESWARSRKPAVRLGSALGDSVILGEPLLAAPEAVVALADCGDRVVMITDHRAYVVAADGRPLQAAVAIPGDRRQVIGYDGRAVGSVRLAGGTAHLMAVRLADGATVTQGSLPVGKGQSFGDDRVVADDGSAMAVVQETEDPAGGAGQVAVMVATAAGGAAKPVNVPSSLLGVGRDGAWIIGGGAPNIMVVAGERRLTASAAACGPGIAACISDGRALLIRQDGKAVVLAGAPAIGSEPGMATVGSWLVVASGSGAKAVSTGDLLGDGAGAVSEQPPTLAFWRWADLLADPTAKPVMATPGELSVASMFQAAVWAWADKQLDLVDLSGRDPRRAAFVQAQDHIRWVSSQGHCARVHLRDGRFGLYGPDHQELWLGNCEGVEVPRRDLALIHRLREGHHSWALVTLSTDAAKRVETRLELPDQEQEVAVSCRFPDIIVARADRRWWRSLGFDGKTIETARDAGPKAVPPPRCPQWTWYCPPGRFEYDIARVRSKDAVPPESPLADLQLADAWRAGGSTILLERTGRVLVSGRKRGEWTDLPAVAAGDRLAMAGNTPVVAAGDDLRMVATFAPGPKLAASEGQAIASDMPSGPWRLEGQRRFSQPHGRQYEWDEERLGWPPLHLRSPDASGLLIVTPSVLIELDPAAAKMFGR